jgi:hypothetical protein
MATLAPDVELVSPLSGRMVFRGREDVRTLAGAVYGSLRGLRWDSQAVTETGETVFVAGSGRIGPLRLDDAMVFELDPESGLIRRVRPHLRPWLALSALALRLLPTLARRPGMTLRALRR